MRRFWRAPHGADWRLCARGMGRVAIVAGMLGVASSCRGGTSTGPAWQISDESLRWKLGSALPAQSPLVRGHRVEITVARGETFGLTVSGAVTFAGLYLPSGHGAHHAATADVRIASFAQMAVAVRTPSTAMYGTKLRGVGWYADELRPVAPVASAPRSAVLPSATTGPWFVTPLRDHAAPPATRARFAGALFDLAVATTAQPQTRWGLLIVNGVSYLVQLTIAAPVLELGRYAWAYYDRREFWWQWQVPPAPPTRMPPLGETDEAQAFAAERACIATFAAHGVLLSTTHDLAQWPRYADTFAEAAFVPVRMQDHAPANVRATVAAWSNALAGTTLTPFAIPIDEPSTPGAIADVAALAQVVRQARDAARAANPQAKPFQFAVTADPAPSFGPAIDIFIALGVPTPNAPLTSGPPTPTFWTYNGRPPRAGNMVIDAPSLSVRTWGAIGHQFNLPIWYIWDALYWHDRHNRNRSRDATGRPLDTAQTAVSFANTDERGNGDGVLATFDRAQGCYPTLRLKQLRRGLLDRALMRAADCQGAGGRIATALVPAALGQAPREGAPAWSSDANEWEAARRELIAAATACRPQ